MVSLQELLTLPADPTYYLSFPLIPKGGRIVIGAPPKHFKSMLALNLAYDLAEAEPLWGLKKADGGALWEVKRPLSILYVEQEIGRYRVKERMEKIHGARGGELAPLNLHFECKGSGIMLDTDVGRSILEERVEQLKPDVLVIDPLRKFHTQDEDSSTEMVKVFKALDNIQERHELTALILHHTSKRSEFRDPSDPESLRGSGEIFADGDTFIMLTKPIKGNDNIIRLHFNIRSSASPKPVTLEFDEGTYLFKKQGN